MGINRLAPLSTHDLIDDRALKELTDDALGAEGFVNELTDLCCVASPPTSIALYGSWGSGKSSIGNLLEAELKERKIHFARFDAFKWVAIPLKRRFLSVIATQFEIEDERYHSGLYVSSNRNHLKITKGEEEKLFKLFAFVGAFLLGLLIAISALGAALGTGEFGTEYLANLRNGLGGVFLSAPLITAVIALLSHHLSITTTTHRPSDDEEFEELFKQLMAEVTGDRKDSRVVLFIDELDRCSPSEVVETLEAIRTFLDVEPCITVIAADQQVLEHALSIRVRQATPPDAVNPYYSSGSAYLDKIFQLQITLPPLMPRRLTRFALSLVEGRKGTWELVPNLAQVISVLVPTHVSSPRRVKHLLNAFILAFRAALARERSGLLAEDMAARASEIARLTALQVEFPLFARDLLVDHRLADVITHRLEGSASSLDDDFPGLPERTKELVNLYLKNALPPDLLLSSKTDETKVGSGEKNE